MDSEEVRKRKEYAEKKVRERHAALRKEAEERRKASVEHRERVQSQLRREQVLIQKRMQQLNEDEERKKATLAKQHEATSRIANITKSPKSFAFGSSTPRSLAYLDNLPKSEQQYDKKLKPIDDGTPIITTPPSRNGRQAAPRAPPPAHKPARAMNAMTSSMYVTSSAPVARTAKSIAKPAAEVPTRRHVQPSTSSMMTQSVYAPSNRGGPIGTRNVQARNNTRATPPRGMTPPTTGQSATGRRPTDVRKPPMPRRNLNLGSKPNVEESKKLAAKVPEPVKEKEVVKKVEEPLISLEEEVSNVVEKKENEEVEQDVPEVVAPILEVQEQKQEIVVVEEKPEEVAAPQSLSDELVEVTQHSEHVEEQTQNEESSKVDVVIEPEEPKIIIPTVESHPEEETKVQQDVEEVDEIPQVPTPQSLADELVEIVEEEEHVEHEEVQKEEEQQQTVKEQEVVQEKPEIKELEYKMPVVESPETIKRPSLNDLVDVFGNDLIINEQHHHHHHHVEFDEDEEADSGKASPTSSETSSTTDEVTPRRTTTVVEKIEDSKVIIPRVIPSVKSLEDMEKKEREAEERKAKLAAILAKSRGMPLPNATVLPGSVPVNDSPIASPPASAAQITPEVEKREEVKEVEREVKTESAQASNGGASTSANDSTMNRTASSDVLARLAASSNLPSLQKLLQRKQGSNPSLQTTESTGGEIYP